MVSQRSPSIDSRDTESGSIEAGSLDSAGGDLTSADETGAPGTPEFDEIMLLLADDAPKLMVEVGSHDGVTMSTSLPLIQRGWSSILVEPHPEIFERLLFVHGMNPDVYCVNGACGDQAGLMTLNIGVGDNTMLSSLVTEDNVWTQAVRSGRSVEVQVYQLRDLLESRNWPADYSVLLVDTEGFDSKVLQGAGLERWRPRVIVTEEYLFSLEWLREKHQLLWSYGYAPFKRTGDNMIWIRESEWDEALSRYNQRVMQP